MPIIDNKILTPMTYIKDLSRKPTPSETLAYPVLQGKFDQGAEDLRVKLNSLIDSLGIKTTDSGAKNIGVNSIDGLTGNDVQTLLQALKNQLNGVVLGSLPGGSITDDKLSNAVGDIKERLISSLADIIQQVGIDPDSYKAPTYDTDFKKLQQAINDAITNKKGIVLGRVYDITGQGSLMLSLKYGQRWWTTFSSFNNGGIIKSDAGFMFSSTTANTSDFVFNNVTFTGNVAAAVKVFDCDKLIGITTNDCYHYNLTNVFYTTDAKYLQSITMNGDLIFNILDYVANCNGAFNCRFMGALQEASVGGFFKQRGVAGAFNYCNGVVISVGVESISDVTKPAIYLEDCRGVSIEGGYIEANAGGDIVLAPGGSFLSLTIKNVAFNNATINPIQLGGALGNCKISDCINIGAIGLIKTTNVTSGYVVSDNNYFEPLYPNTDPGSKIRTVKYNAIDPAYTSLPATDGFTSTLTGGEIKRITSTLASIPFTANETKTLAFVFPEMIYSDTMLSIWSYDKTGLDFTIKNWWTSIDRLTVYYLVTNNTGASMSIAKLRVTAVKFMTSPQG